MHWRSPVIISSDLAPSRNMAGINTLPSDVLPIIFSSLGARDLAASALTCTEFHDLSRDRQDLLHLNTLLTYLYATRFSALLLAASEPFTKQAHCPGWPLKRPVHVDAVAAGSGGQMPAPWPITHPRRPLRSASPYRPSNWLPGSMPCPPSSPMPSSPPGATYIEQYGCAVTPRSLLPPCSCAVS